MRSLSISAIGMVLVAAVAPSVAQLELFVSTEGSDSNSGASPADALRTITKARDLLRARHPLPSTGAVVNILPGVYMGEAPIELTAADSGASSDGPLVFRAVNASALTKVSGGVSIPASAWTACPSKHPALLAAGASLPAQAKCASLAKLGVTSDQIGELVSGGLGDCQHDHAVFSYNSAWMPLARYPNIMANGSWNFTHSVGGNTNGVINTSDPRPLRWAGESEPWIHGYPVYDWADYYEGVMNITTRPGGVSGAQITIAYHVRHGPWEPKARFIGINLLSELDSAGEWFVDKDDAALTLYFWAPDQSTLEAFDGNSPVEREANPRLAGRRGVLRAPSDDGAYIGVASNVFELSNGTSYVRFEVLQIESSIGAGINCTRGDCIGIQVSGVTASMHGRVGIQLNNATGASVENSEAHSVGCTGIAVSGGDYNTLSPSGIVVSGNAVHQMGQWKRTYKPGIHWGGVGVTLENNHVFNGPHQAILGGGTRSRPCPR